MNSGWFAEMYFGGFVTAITDIDPGFKLDPDLFTLGNTIYFDPDNKTMTPSGKLMSMPIQPNIPMLFYRGDLYKEKGLKPVETFDDFQQRQGAAQSAEDVRHRPARRARSQHRVLRLLPYLFGMGGAIFKDQAAGDYTVILNDDKGKEALDYYLRLARRRGIRRPPRWTRRTSSRRWSPATAPMPASSSRPGRRWTIPKNRSSSTRSNTRRPRMRPACRPGPALGHWLGGISHNVPDERKRAAVEFFRWFQTKDAQLANAKSGGIPLNAVVYTEPMAEERQFRWMKPLAAALPHAINPYAFPEASEVISVLELGLNRAIAGEISSVDALNSHVGRHLQDHGQA